MPLKRFVAATLLLWMFLFIIGTTPFPVHGVQPIYGGIASQRYVNQSEVIWWQNTAFPLIPSLTMNWKYAVQCTNNLKNASFPNDPYFYDSGTITYQVGSGTGFGKFFPCEGWLIYASFEIGNPGTIATGQNYSQVLILETMPAGGGINPIQAVNIGAGSQIKQCLIGVNSNSFYTYSWPATGCRPPAEGPGLNQSVTVSNPGAGVNFQNLLSNLVRHRIINIQFTLTTSATVQNRFACINFLTGGVSGTVVGRACSPYAQIASTTVIYNFGNATGWATNCSLMGATQTAVQCPAITVPMAQYWESTAAFETFAINSAVLTETGANGLAAGDSITNIFIRETVWGETN